MNKQDIRWAQRFSNYKKALAQLERFVKKKSLNELEAQGIIQSFEYTFELAWNVMKDLYEDQGESGIQGSKDAIRLAFKRGLIQDGELWMSMVENRKLTTHTYNEDTASKMVKLIQKEYFPCFISLLKTLEDRLSQQLSL
ncbi:MAG: nucleotidyltransferase substrate binding protein [Cyclobacteriaceae bacterium]|nr:nucleotidyltransferase substrate binding protein [Cyclobacteriaceae bacterium]